MEYLDVEGARICYAAGKGEDRADVPVLLVHGAGGSQHVWLRQLEPEIPGYRLLALDLPGHARSEGAGSRSVEEYCDFVGDFMDAAGFEKIVLGGHSMGGAITQRFALKYPRRLRGIVLVGTGARLRVAETVLENARKGINLPEYAYSPQTSKSLISRAEMEFDLTSPQVRYGDFLACDGFDLMEEVHKIDAKTLIVCGEEDRLTPPKYSVYLRERIPGAVYEPVPDAGHMVMWEKADAVNKALEGFLKRL